MNFAQLGKMLIGFGALMIVLGGVMVLLGKIPGLGKLPGDILMAGHQRDKGCNQQHRRKSIKSCGKDSSFFRGLCDWIAVHLHQCALLSLRGALFLRDWGWAAPS